MRDYSLNEHERNFGRPFERPIYQTNALITDGLFKRPNIPALSKIKSGLATGEIKIIVKADTNIETEAESERLRELNMRSIELEMQLLNKLYFFAVTGIYEMK